MKTRLVRSNQVIFSVLAAATFGMAVLALSLLSGAASSRHDSWVGAILAMIIFGAVGFVFPLNWLGYARRQERALIDWLNTLGRRSRDS